MRALALVVLVASCSKDAAKNPGFEGTYEDWDSYEDDPFFVKDPTFTRDGELLRIEADGYLPTIVTVADDARAPFAARGMLRSRIERFYAGLPETWTWDPTTALVLIEIRRHPNHLEPFEGVKVDVQGVRGYRRNWDAGWSPAKVTGEGSRYIIFPNVPVGGGWATLEFSAAGAECRGPKTIKVEAGAVAFAQVSCARRKS